MPAECNELCAVYHIDCVLPVNSRDTVSKPSPIVLKRSQLGVSQKELCKIFLPSAVNLRGLQSPAASV